MSFPNVTIVSPFRDNATQVRDFAREVQVLDYPPEHMRINCIEGDSNDNTFAMLKFWESQNNQVRIIKCDTGERKFPSVVSSDRFAHLAKVFNPCIESVDWEWSDYSLIIPSDVTFSPSLVSTLVMAEKDLISPMFWIGDLSNGGARFYDIWGFVKDGQNFKGYPFAWYEIHLPTTEPFEMDYIGGAMLMSKRVFESGARYTPEKADRGLIDTAKEKGFTPWCHPMAHILHR